MVIVATKIKLIPTKEQEVLFWKSAGVARWAYNYYLSENEQHYKEYLDGKHEQKTLKEGEVRKYINNVLKKTTHTWLKDVGSNVMKQGVKDADEAYKRWFKGGSKKPKFKSRHKSKISFYVNYESLKRMNNGFRGEKIGFVRTTQPLPKLQNGKKYSNPRISYDGKYWFLSIGYEIDVIETELTDTSLGIDLGVKDLAICSSGKVYKNINKTKEVIRLEKKLKREQRKLSRKIEANIENYSGNRRPIYKKSLSQMRNIQKQNNVIRGLHKRLTDIMKTKPYRIVIEDLNVSGMMKNKHLSNAIAKQKLYEFRRQLEYKTKRYGIELVLADRWYASSKTCSKCGAIKSDLKLKDRIFKCECGHVIDRDLNASINLANYQI